MQTQRDRLLAILMERGEQGVFVYELIAPRPQGLGIAQYNARIKELRSRGYVIINKEPGHFVLMSNGITDDLTTQFVTVEQLKAELADLRKTWEIAPANARKKIEVQGMELKKQIENLEAFL